MSVGIFPHFQSTTSKCQRQYPVLLVILSCASVMSCRLRPPSRGAGPTPPTSLPDTPRSRTSHFTSSGITSVVRHQSSVESCFRDELFNIDKTTQLSLIVSLIVSTTRPTENSEEMKYYKPWASMLTDLCSTLRDLFRTIQSPTPLRDVYFYSYDRNVQHPSI
jgi:hypothetical protein